MGTHHWSEVMWSKGGIDAIISTLGVPLEAEDRWSPWGHALRACVMLDVTTQLSWYQLEEIWRELLIWRLDISWSPCLAIFVHASGTMERIVVFSTRETTHRRLFPSPRLTKSKEVQLRSTFVGGSMFVGEIPVRSTSARSHHRWPILVEGLVLEWALLQPLSHCLLWRATTTLYRNRLS